MDNGAGSYHRFLDGDDNGIVEIVRDYKDGLILFLNQYVHNVQIAEELAEDTFVRIVTRKPRFSADYSFKTWLYTIGRNIAVNYIRHESRTADAPPEELESLSKEEETLEQAYLREEQRITVHKALSRIHPDYGAVLYLKFFEDLTNEQIAKVTKKNKRQIENRLLSGQKSIESGTGKGGISL